jgi:hypothetical protein
VSQTSASCIASQRFALEMCDATVAEKGAIADNQKIVPRPPNPLCLLRQLTQIAHFLPKTQAFQLPVSAMIFNFRHFFD